MKQETETKIIYATCVISFLMSITPYLYALSVQNDTLNIENRINNASDHLKNLNENLIESRPVPIDTPDSLKPHSFLNSLEKQEMKPQR